MVRMREKPLPLFRGYILHNNHLHIHFHISITEICIMIMVVSQLYNIFFHTCALKRFNSALNLSLSNCKIDLEKIFYLHCVS